MTKRDLVVKIARETNLNQGEVAEVVQKTLDHIADELISGSVCPDNPRVYFGIGPMAGIEGNYSKVFADVGGWVETGVVDYLMPQLYFGFDFGIEAYRFDTLLARWRDLTRGNKVALYVGLGAYRIGTDEAGHEEWTEHHDVLARQIDRGRQAGCAGYCFYSYSALFAEDDATLRDGLQAAALLQAG